MFDEVMVRMTIPPFATTDVSGNRDCETTCSSCSATVYATVDWVFLSFSYRVEGGDYLRQCYCYEMFVVVVGDT